MSPPSKGPPMRTLAALLLTLPLAAAAQSPAPASPAAPEASPPALPAPAAPPPCPACPVCEPPPARGRWYAGFGLGGGLGRATDSFGDGDLGNWVDGGSTTLFLQAQAGLTLTPHLLLGADVGVLGTASRVAGVGKSVWISNYDAMLTWYPLERGPFLRGGAGLSVFTRSWSGFSTGQFKGGNLTVGAGWAFPLARSFNLTVHADYSSQWYGSNAISLSRSSFAALWLGFDWY